MSEETNSNCQRFESRIAELISGEAPTAGFVELCMHVRGCDECGEVLEIHGRLQDLSAPETRSREEPKAEEWDRVRATVLAQLASGAADSVDGFGSGAGSEPVGREIAESSTTPRVSLDRSVAHRLGRPLEWLAAAALATALLGSGWWLGRGAGGSSTPSAQPTLAARSASPQTFAVDDSLDGYEIDNVRVRDVDDDMVSVSFDLATHVETLRPRTDPLVREAVVRSLWGSADLGGRIAAIEQAGELTMSDTVRDALLHAMLQDPDVAVRMSAQQRLASSGLDEHVEPALLQVLRTEQSVQMRLLAVDMLASRRTDPGELVRAVEEGEPEPGNALKLLAANYARRF